MIEKDFDVSFIARLALREKQIQQAYRPIIAVHKWFARRPGSLFRGLLLAEFQDRPLSEAYFESHQFDGITVADPFMGGGTPLLEANRLGCDVIGYDINPMAYWIVRQEIETLNVPAYLESAHHLRSALERTVGRYYRTGCLVCGREDAPAKYFLWVKVQVCPGCGRDVDLFPSNVLARDSRHPKNVIVCSHCGELNERTHLNNPGFCGACHHALSASGPARRGAAKCQACGHVLQYPDGSRPRHRPFAIEYHCPDCRSGHAGRFFKKPDADDLSRLRDAETELAHLSAKFIPEDAIPEGDETKRLHRWGYVRYRDLFNHRQLLGLELSARLISDHEAGPIRNALATNLSDLVRYQNMLCRYDPVALKSLDVFSVHGFPVSLIQCESNLIGVTAGEVGASVGSGGWSNIVRKYAQAKSYCESPFEVADLNGRKRKVRVAGEWIGEARQTGRRLGARSVSLECRSATATAFEPGTLDAVLTDPPYFGNVQYAELMDLCYVWLRRLVDDPCFAAISTRHPEELTGNISMGRGLEQFTEGLSAAFTNSAHGLKAGAPLVFTYHHNRAEAYQAVAVALLNAGVVCTAVLPCPAEMGASIHISGTGSSILDSVFVCRATGRIQRQSFHMRPDDVGRYVHADITSLQDAGVRLRAGDVRCLTYGHLTRLCVWALRADWSPQNGVTQALDRVGRWFNGAASFEEVLEIVKELAQGEPSPEGFMNMLHSGGTGVPHDAVSF